MLKLSLTALSAVTLLGLTACGDTVEEGDTTIVEGTSADPAYVPDVVIDADNEPTGDRISIGEDGISGTVNDGGTTVTADIDGSPTMTIETE